MRQFDNPNYLVSPIRPIGVNARGIVVAVPVEVKARRFERFLRRRPLSKVSIQSKLVVMMVLCTIVAATVVGIIGFQTGRSSLRDLVFNRLTEVRESQSRALQDTNGNVVYSAHKDVDLGTNILSGPYNGSKLRGAYEKALSSNALDYVGFTDFEIYQPAENVPTAWMVTPVVANGRAEGVLAMQFPATKINRLMTFDNNWATAGLGGTGETFLAGPDGLMRSDSRLFLADPQAFRRDVV